MLALMFFITFNIKYINALITKEILIFCFPEIQPFKPRVASLSTATPSSTDTSLPPFPTSSQQRRCLPNDPLPFPNLICNSATYVFCFSVHK